MMQTLLLETGDLVQIRSTDLEPARLVKLQPQSINFLDISDPKAVLEKAFRNFSTLTKGDVFSFNYNDTVYDVAVLEVKPESEKMGVCMIETDVSVDFAPPVGYIEPSSNKGSGHSTPRSGRGLPSGGMLHSQGTMAQAINYDSIKPLAVSAAAGARAVSSNFVSQGQKLKGTKAPTPQVSTPASGTSTNPEPAKPARVLNGPQPLRLPPTKLFFGFDVKPLKTQGDKDRENANARQPHFTGQGQTLRGGPAKPAEKMVVDEVEVAKSKPSKGQRLDGREVL